MVALISPHLIRHDARTMHTLVMGQLRESRTNNRSRMLLELLAEEARACIRHMLHCGVPHHLDGVAVACCEILEHASGQLITDHARRDAQAQLRDACARMRDAHGTEAAPIDHILVLGRLAARLPRLTRCTEAHRVTLAAPITGLMLHLFG